MEQRYKSISRRSFLEAGALAGGAAVVQSVSAASASAEPFVDTAAIADSARLFTKDDLDLLATPLSIHLERAAKSESDKELSWIQQQMDLESVVIYNSYLQWIPILQTFIISERGEAQHNDALREYAEHAFAEEVLAYKGLDQRSHVELLASRLRASGSTFQVEESSSKISFRLDPWGPMRQVRKPSPWQSDTSIYRREDRLYYQNTGEYDPPVSHAILRNPSDLTQSRHNLPCVLSTEVLFLEILPIKLLGYPIAVISIPEDPVQPTILDVYKDAREIPEHIYSRVGLAKPEGGMPDACATTLFDTEDLELLGTPLSLRVERAGREKKWSDLLDISAGMDRELVCAKDSMGVLIAGLLTWIARHMGEDAVEQALVKTAEVVMAPYVDAVRDLPTKEAIQNWAMVWRAHGSTFKIEESEKTFIFRGRHLGACGRMWAHRYQTEVERISSSRVRYPTFGAYDPPMNFHLMRTPRGITHGKSDYPIYSCHCHMLHEIYPIDQIGHPLWVEFHPVDDQDGDTVHLHYKNPQEWPEEYYLKVGRTKQKA